MGLGVRGLGRCGGAWGDAFSFHVRPRPACRWQHWLRTVSDTVWWEAPASMRCKQTTPQHYDTNTIYDTAGAPARVPPRTPVPVPHFLPHFCTAQCGVRLAAYTCARKAGPCAPLPWTAYAPRDAHHHSAWAHRPQCPPYAYRTVHGACIHL